MLQPERVGEFNRVRAYNDGLVVYLYDDSQIGIWRRLSEREQARRYTRSVKEFAARFAPGDLLAYELPQDDSICLDVAVRPPLTDGETARLCLRESLTGLLSLPTGRLCVECANNVRFDPDHVEAEMDEDERGTLIEVPPRDYRVWLYHVDFDSLPQDELLNYQGPQQVVTLEAVEAGMATSSKGNFLPHPINRKACPAAKPDTSWAGQYTIESGVFTGMFVHNYHASGTCMNFDRRAADELGLKIGDRLAIEFEGTRIVVIFLGDLNIWGDPEDPTADELARTPNQSKCGLIIEREQVDKLMLTRCRDRDLYSIELRKTPLYGTPVRIKRLD